MNINFQTLGCPKNFSDTEMAQSILRKHNHFIVNDPMEADAIVVNTCGFIEAAKIESIDKIFEMINLEVKHNPYIIVSGCLSKRYSNELKEEMPEIDAFIGVNDYDSLPHILNELNKHEKRFDNDAIVKVDDSTLDYLPFQDRSSEDVGVTATIKIGEGCNNACAYCIIPKIRGRYRSKSIEDILKEARQLAEKGCKELVLIAQDTTYYGQDIYGKKALADLLSELCKIDEIHWIRIMYSYEDKVTDDLIEVMAQEKKICKYIDIPLQHGSDNVLKRMHRPGSQKTIMETISKLRKRIKDIHIRTTLIVGFPGETDDDFDELMNFVQKAQFDRMGAFKYSKEEGTVAAAMNEQVPEDVKEFRLDQLMRLQMDISLEKNKAKIGNVYEVLVEASEEEAYVGRTMFDAQDIDNQVIFTSPRELKAGDFVYVKINDAYDYDLIGEEVISECSK